MNVFEEYSFDKYCSIKLPMCPKFRPDEETTNEWAKQALSYFEENPNETTYLITSGDLMVVATKDNTFGIIHIYDTRIVNRAVVELK